MKPIDTHCCTLNPQQSVITPIVKRASAGIFLGIALSALGVLPIASAAEVSPDVQYIYSEGRGEGLSVSSDGKQILLSSPIDTSGGAETEFSSFVPCIKHHPNSDPLFKPSSNLALPGEVTDVVAMAHNQFDLAVVRGDLQSSLNALIAFKGDRILQTIEMPDKADGFEVTPDGNLAIVAVEKGGEIRIYDLTAGAGQIYLAAVVTKPALAAYYQGMPDRAGVNNINLEPEAVGIAPDSSFALVTIQDSASIAALDLTEVGRGIENGLTPAEIGDLVLKNVVHLPFGYKGQNGALFGVEPDGVAISPDASFAMIAHEANQRAKHLQGFSILDLRGGLTGVIPQKSYNIFNIDPLLLNNTGLATPPPLVPETYPTDANKLPRLDPASVEIIRSEQDFIAVLVIERYDPSSAQLAASIDNETQGSVLFLNVTNALNDITSSDRMARVSIGAEKSRLEGIDSAQHGRWIFVSVSNGGGVNPSAARFEIVK